MLCSFYFLFFFLVVLVSLLLFIYSHQVLTYLHPTPSFLPAEEGDSLFLLTRSEPPMRACESVFVSVYTLISQSLDNSVLIPVSVLEKICV